jgi:hypothetical protein
LLFVVITNAIGILTLVSFKFEIEIKDQPFFLDNDFDGEDFTFMTKLASWGVSGFKTTDKTFHLNNEEK